jgi:Zn-dependent peptidase ImmA (M78 family)
MSAAHELAHLVMHQPVTASVSEMEDQAKRFASAFLLPAEAIRQELVGPVTLDSFVNMKLRWGVSVQALIVRAHDLQIVTDRKYRTLFQQLSARGWRLNEPLSTKVPLERPRAVRQVAELLYGKKINYAKAAADLHYPESFLRALFEAHASKEPTPRVSGPRQGSPIQFHLRQRR